MSKRIGEKMISRRRMFGILGAGVAFGMATPAAVLTASDAEAQTPGVEPRPDQRPRSTSRPTPRPAT